MTYKIEIEPQSHVRSTQGDKWVFRIPEWKLKPSGLARKKRLQKYNDYKHDLSVLCIQKGILKPLESGIFEVTFYIAAPQYYRPVKERGEIPRKLLDGTYHRRKPDADNLLKAVNDALFRQDSFICDVRVRKYWTLQDKGWVEFKVQNAPSAT